MKQMLKVKGYIRIIPLLNLLIWDDVETELRDT